MKTLSSALIVLAVLATGSFGRAAQLQPVELVGTATDFWQTRQWNSYYWRVDFTFLLREETSGRTWRIISRETTPAYDWAMGPTYTNLKIDWQDRPRVRVLGVRGVDRLPAEFYDFKLDEPCWRPPSLCGWRMPTARAPSGT